MYAGVPSFFCLEGRLPAQCLKAAGSMWALSSGHRQLPTVHNLKKTSFLACVGLCLSLCVCVCVQGLMLEDPGPVLELGGPRSFHDCFIHEGLCRKSQ